MASGIADASQESLHDGQQRILAMVNRGESLESTLTELCKLIESREAGMLCSVLLLDDAHQHLLHGAAPSLPEDYCAAIHGISVGDGVGSCGTAAATGKPCYVGDIATHPNWAAFRGLAFETHGLQACWSTPILSQDGHVVATFAIYYREPRMPTLAERKLIDFSAHLVTIAVNQGNASAKKHSAAN